MALALTFYFFAKTQNQDQILEKVKNSYGNILVKTSDFESNKLLEVQATKGDMNLFLKIGSNYNKSIADNYLEKERRFIEDLAKPRKVLDPYLGKETEFKIPESLKPVKDELLVNGNNVTYYTVYVNEIYSYFIFSEDQASFKGIVSIFSCNNNVYKIELFSEINSFNKEKMLNEFEGLICK